MILIQVGVVCADISAVADVVWFNHLCSPKKSRSQKRAKHGKIPYGTQIRDGKKEKCEHSAGTGCDHSNDGHSRKVPFCPETHKEEARADGSTCDC